MKSGPLAMLCVCALFAFLIVELGPTLNPWQRLVFDEWPYILGYALAVLVNLWVLFYWVGRKAGLRESGQKLAIFDHQLEIEGERG